MLRTRTKSRGGRRARGKTAAERRDVVRKLTDRIESLAGDLKGEPSLKRKLVWRWGARGSFVVNVGGARKGFWYSFEDAKGGDALALIETERGLDAAGALAFARNWLGD